MEEAPWQPHTLAQPQKGFRNVRQLGERKKLKGTPRDISHRKGCYLSGTSLWGSGACCVLRGWAGREAEARGAGWPSQPPVPALPEASAP